MKISKSRTMKKLFLILFCAILLGISCNEQITELSDEQKASIISEVEKQYAKVVTDLSTLDMEIWSQPYSEDNFISVNSLTQYFPMYSEWKDSVTFWFSLRESQEVEIVDVNTTVLSSDLVLLTSIGYWDLSLKSGDQIKDAKTLVSLLWKKEEDGWKIIYLHESWQVD